MEEIRNLIIPLEQEARLNELVADHLKRPVGEIAHIRFIRRSLDARKKGQIRLVYHLEVFGPGESVPTLPGPEDYSRDVTAWDRPRGSAVVVGAGPAGLFAAFELRRKGWDVTVIERGSAVMERRKKIARFLREGQLDPDDNVCFGLGGAGLYSDGKLNTRIKHKEVREVLEVLAAFGAPEDILWKHEPHIGTDRVQRVIERMSAWLAAHGVRFLLNTRFSDFEVSNGAIHTIHALHLGDAPTSVALEADGLFLACGHGASDVYRLLGQRGVHLEAKPFAVGIRVQHPQSFINQRQYGPQASHPALEPASYHLAANPETFGRGVYSFCMCPGGHVIPASTDETGLVINGMSNRDRSSAFANAAVVCTVDGRDWGDSPESALLFRESLEQRALQLARESGARRAEVPGCYLSDFLSGQVRVNLPVKTGCLGGTVTAPVNRIFPDPIREALREGLAHFNSRIRGFCEHAEALVFGVESRTSAPIRIVRDEKTFESVTLRGLYPIGEGAGYAGGIVSSAVDGLRAARQKDSQNERQP